MSSTLNKVMLIGYLGEDVKMHYFENGGCIGRFSLATHETYVNKTTNEKITNTEWHQIVVRNKAAELCEKHLSKGDKIYVEGRIRSRQWQAEDGTNKQLVEIHVSDFVFLQTKKETALPTKEEQLVQLKKQAIDNFIIPKENNEDNIPF